MDEWKLQPARDLGMSVKDRARSLQREDGLLETGIHVAWWWAVRGWLAAWHRLKIVNAARLPVSPPLVLVANHSSHLDALVLAAALPRRLRHRTFPIAAGDTFFETPAVAAFAALALNALPMWRKNCGPHALQQLRERLIGEPCGYILFPEGTRTRDGRMNRFKSGIGMLVANTDVPVVPCALSGCFEAWPPHGGFPRPKRIAIKIGDPISFANVSNDRAGWETIAHALEEHCRRLKNQCSNGIHSRVPE